MMIVEGIEFGIGWAIGTISLPSFDSYCSLDIASFSQNRYTESF